MMIEEIKVAWRPSDEDHIPVLIMRDEDTSITLELPMYQYGNGYEYFQPVTQPDDGGEEDYSRSLKDAVHPELLPWMNRFADTVRRTLRTAKLDDRVHPDAAIRFPVPCIAQVMTGVEAGIPWISTR